MWSGRGGLGGETPLKLILVTHDKSSASDSVFLHTLNSLHSLLSIWFFDITNDRRGVRRHATCLGRHRPKAADNGRPSPGHVRCLLIHTICCGLDFLAARSVKTTASHLKDVKDIGEICFLEWAETS